MNVKEAFEKIKPGEIEKVITRLVAGFEHYRHLYDREGVLKYKYLCLCNDYRDDTVTVTDSEGGSIWGYGMPGIEGDDTLEYNMDKLIAMLFRGHNYAAKIGIPKNTDVETLRDMIAKIWESNPDPGPRPTEKEMIDVIEASKTEYQKKQNPFAEIEEAMRKNNMID